MPGEPFQLSLAAPANPSNAKLAERLDVGDERMSRIESDLVLVGENLAQNTTMTKHAAVMAEATAENTRDLVEFFTAFKGAFRVLEYIGKLAKPLGYIAAVGTAVTGLWATFKGGR